MKTELSALSVLNSRFNVRAVLYLDIKVGEYRLIAPVLIIYEKAERNISIFCLLLSLCDLFQHDNCSPWKMECSAIDFFIHARLCFSCQMLHIKTSMKRETQPAKSP